MSLWRSSTIGASKIPTEPMTSFMSVLCIRLNLVTRDYYSEHMMTNLGSRASLTQSSGLPRFTTPRCFRTARIIFAIMRPFTQSMCVILLRRGEASYRSRLRFNSPDLLDLLYPLALETHYLRPQRLVKDIRSGDTLERCLAANVNHARIGRTMACTRSPRSAVFDLRRVNRSGSVMPVVIRLNKTQRHGY